MFEQAMRMFLPFGSATAAARSVPAAKCEAPEAGKGGDDLDALRRQVEEMQSRLNKLSDRK
jgi:polyhydroxyalkanoate synthesis regulator protein